MVVALAVTELAARLTDQSREGSRRKSRKERIVVSKHELLRALGLDFGRDIHEHLRVKAEPGTR
jgi:hypothetical protein